MPLIDVRSGFDRVFPACALWGGVVAFIQRVGQQVSTRPRHAPKTNLLGGVVVSHPSLRSLVIAFGLSACGVSAFAAEHDDARRILGYGETFYPQFFAPPGAAVASVAGYLAGHYPITQTYLGTKDGLVYVYGDVFGGLKNVGSVAYFLSIMNFENREAEFVPAPGTYTGQTSQSLPVTIVVGPTGAIESVRVSLRWSLGLDSCVAPFAALGSQEDSGAPAIVNGALDTQVTFSSLSTRLAGSYRSGAFSGVIDAYDQPNCSYICGSRFIIGTCGSMWGSRTWQATRQ